VHGFLRQFFQVEQVVLAQLPDVGAFQRAAGQADKPRAQPEGLAIAFGHDQLFGDQRLDDAVDRRARIAKPGAQLVHRPGAIATRRDGVEHAHELGKRSGAGNGGRRNRCSRRGLWGTVGGLHAGDFH